MSARDCGLGHLVDALLGEPGFRDALLRPGQPGAGNEVPELLSIDVARSGIRRSTAL
jgi:hypothetical protein